ncbi:MAG: adenylate/guanylate cyclase domain-containing protein [Treponema sp.]|nr:adenylate/guanylate cyclase domain-containing protein [Treponema sp.]
MGVGNQIKNFGNKLVLPLFFVSALMTLFIALYVNAQMENYEAMVVEMTENHMISAVQALVNLTNADELDLIHTRDDMNRPEYLKLREKLIKFSEDNNVLFAYYYRSIGNNQFEYIIDNDLDQETRVKPGDIESFHDAAEYDALAGIIGVTDLGSYSPDWEGLLSAYAPVFDGNGNVYCIAGVDISDDFILMQRSNARNMTIFQLIVIPISIIFALLNMLLYRRKAIQIEEAHRQLQYFNNNLRRAFSTYLSEDVVEEIVSDPTRLQLGGINRNMTALFTDIKGFTRIAEVLNPGQLVDLLNYYLSTMSDIILDQKGTIDKYQGDAIISFFGAPLELEDHALRACITAITMKRLEKKLNKYVLENKLSPTPLFTRIGINSGEMIVGNMGTQKKMNYTIISNAVNLASRIEGVNKQYGTGVLATENTIKDTQGKLLVRKLDRIRVVGINEPVRIYEIIDIKADASRARRDRIDIFTEAYGLFESRKWMDAELIFNKLLEQFPDDKPSLLYQVRCRKFQKTPPDPNWDGVFNLSEK